MISSRELDALVAEKVMGWEPVRGIDILIRENGTEETAKMLAAASSDRWHSRLAWFIGNERKACEECGTLPDYSTSIAAAWNVVEQFIECGVAVQCCRKEDWSNDKWKCIIATDFDIDPRRYVEARAETAPLAICLAALKAVGEQVPA